MYRARTCRTRFLCSLWRQNTRASRFGSRSRTVRGTTLILTDGDLATYLAEDAGYALRDHVTNPQTFFEVMSEQLPDVHFTIQQQDAVPMAAMIREQRLEGIVEGLRLAGLLNEAPKRGRTGPQSDGAG